MVALALARPAALALPCASVPASIAPAQLPQSPGSAEKEGYVEGAVIRAPPMEIALGRKGIVSEPENLFVYLRRLE